MFLIFFSLPITTPRGEAAADIAMVDRKDLSPHSAANTKVKVVKNNAISYCLPNNNKKKNQSIKIKVSIINNYLQRMN